MSEIEQIQSICYRKLAENYRSKNVNQCWLCYENAIYHYEKEQLLQNEGRPSSEGEREPGAEKKIQEPFVEECRREMKVLEESPDFAVEKAAIVMLSYNHGDITKACIESIRCNNSPDTYELIVVDNASSDGILDWLRKQQDIKLIENEVNQGFPYGCNQGIALAGNKSDIFLLNNDTIVPENAIFWLRMGLYEHDKIGAVGSVSNNVVNYQQVPGQYETVEEWMEFAKGNNVFREEPYEKKSWLVGFAMLIRRSALEEASCGQEPLDTRFSPGNFEDNDLSIRLLLKGWQLLLVKNSFIFHYGSKAFQKMPVQYLKLLKENRKKLAEKYGMDLIPASAVETALVEMIKPGKPSFRVLEIGCGLGATLARIESRYSEAQVLGTEPDELLAKLAANVTNVVQGELLEKSFEGVFDYVILDEVLSHSAEELLDQAKRYVSPSGKILIAVRNAQCVKKSEEKAGEKKEFTLEEITELCNHCRLQIRDFHYRSARLSLEEREQVRQLCGGTDSPLRPLYEAEKFIFEATR